MKTYTKRSRLARAMSLGLGVALIAGVSLVGATSAQAAAAPYAVSGVVQNVDGHAFEGVTVAGWDMTNNQPLPSVVTNADGEYEFTGFNANVSLTVWFVLDGYGTENGDGVDVAVAGEDVIVPPVKMLPVTVLSGATVTIAGSGRSGEALTATPSATGWPTGAVFDYGWIAPQRYNSGDITGAYSRTYTVTDREVGRVLSVLVSARVPGVSSPSVTIQSNGIAAFADKKPTAAAPTDLAAYLNDNGSTPEAQTTAGLPAGPLDPAKAQTANLPWEAADSFVDVYIFSTPTLVGTFPVANGVAQITLSPAVLGKLSTGNHTLVATGQTSGAVQSLTLAIGLAATGAESPALPITVASFMLLIGAALVLARRRIGQKI